MAQLPSAIARRRRTRVRETSADHGRGRSILFDLPTAVLGFLLLAVILAATALGAFIGHRVRHLSDSLGESFGVMQGAMLGVVGLILAFGLSLALSRYEDRRAGIVTEANAIGTTYLRAQTLSEPARGRSLALLAAYTDSAIQLAENVPGSEEDEDAAATEEMIQRRLWALAGGELVQHPRRAPPPACTSRP